jgi:hypothetical protein
MAYVRFGQAGYGITVVGTAAANAAINVHHALKVSKMQERFQKQLETDAQKIEYTKAIAARFRDVGLRAAKTGKYQPGTKQFEDFLKKILANDMVYKGYCNADIFVPMREYDQPNQPRPIFASISRSGHVSAGAVPRDVGPVWAAKCKMAEDEFRMAILKRVKGERKFQFLKVFKTDIAVKDLALRFGIGLVLVVAMLLLVKMQKALITEQEILLGKKKKKKKKKRRPKPAPKPETKEE